MATYNFYRSLKRFLMDRLPVGRELVLGFALCAFPIYSWAILQFLNRLPSWLYFLKVWDIVGLFAYSQVFALIENLLIFGGFLSLSLLLPRALFRTRFLAVILIVLLFALCGALAFHYFEEDLRAVPRWSLLLGIVAYGLSALASYIKILRWPHSVKIAENIADHLSLLLFLYMPISFLSAVIVLVRNLL